jgi:hypothetical protein
VPANTHETDLAAADNEVIVPLAFLEDNGVITDEHQCSRYFTARGFHLYEAVDEVPERGGAGAFFLLGRRRGRFRGHTEHVAWKDKAGIGNVGIGRDQGVQGNPKTLSYEKHGIPLHNGVPACKAWGAVGGYAREAVVAGKHRGLPPLK